MLIALYDVGVHVAILAHGPLPALLAVADGHLSHQAAHDGCVEQCRRGCDAWGRLNRAQGANLLHCFKIDNFSPTPVWTRPGQKTNLGWRGPKRDFLCFLAPLEELGGSKNQANNSTSIREKVGLLMLCLDPLS